jgi:hypothetical protein
MLESVEAWTRGEITEDDFEHEVFGYQGHLENGPGFARNQGTAQYWAAMAAACDPANVIEHVVEAAVAARDDDYESLPCNRGSVTKIMEAACANLIRGAIRIENHPSLADVIARRNAELCRLPSTTQNLL